VSARSDTILAVVAHPDDESLACGGLLAACAERGVRTAVLCLTRGERGPGGSAGELAAARARELHDAARALGVQTVVLLEHEDGMLPWIDPRRLEEDIAEVIRQLRPEIVVTFDEDGLYWHPDHVAVHERTTAAVAALGTSAPALWYVSIPSGALQELSARGPIFGGIDAGAFGASAPAPAIVLDVTRYASRKLDALRCHRSQTEGTALDSIDAETARRVFGIEHYRRASVGSVTETWIERVAREPAPVAAAARG
jgi:LmbE family N-acetylglucosaminyl deacetylase